LQENGLHLYVFGSRAPGDFQKFSDLDLLISGHPEITLLAKIREELADSYRKNISRDKVAIF
jgi:predicted nucleotidyltransferase